MKKEENNSWGIAVLIIGVLIAGVVLARGGKTQPGPSGDDAVAAVPSGDVQVIDMTAGGGYSPKQVTAEANKETILRVTTKGAFDCSLSLNIPAIGYREVLPPTGVKEIKIPPQKAGTAMRGMCSMGMYGFVINFK